MISSHLRRIYKNNYFKSLILFLLFLPSIEIIMEMYHIKIIGGEVPNPNHAFF